MGVDHFTSSVDNLLEKPMLSSTNGKCEKCEKFSPILRASSQTVVNGSEWECQVEILPSRWHSLIHQVFSELPFVTNENFLEEFHYTVVSCDLLNDSHSWKISKVANNGLPCACVGERSSTIPVRSIPYMTTILGVRKTLNYLKFRNGVKRRIVVTLLIVLYLTFQKELHRLQLLRRKAILTLKSMIDSLEKFTVLQYSYFAAQREILNRHNDDDRIAITIGDLLGSSLDLLYHSMISVVQELLSVSNGSDLSKYCEIYDVSLSELYYRLREPVNDMESRLARLKVVRSFMLCCLLSQNHFYNTNGNSKCDTEMSNFLGKLFTNCTLTRNSFISQCDKLRLVTSNMHQLEILIISMNISMLKYTELLNSCRNPAEDAKYGRRYSKFYLRPKDECSSNQEPIRISTTLHGLRELEKSLIVANTEAINSSTAGIVRQKLTDLLELWGTSDNDDENINPGKKNRISKTKFRNRGLSLDVVHGGKESTVSCGGPQLNVSPKLNDEVTFTAVEDTRSDLDVDFDCELRKAVTIENNNEEKAVITGEKEESSRIILMDQRIAEFKSLSDNELKLKLEERISKFAQENKKGRRDLRTQKSFELMRNPYNDDEFLSLSGAQRQISTASEMTLHSACFEEETIPMYYELQKILDK